MRITIEKAYGGVVVDPHTPVTIMLDGVEQRHCLCADDEAGEVIRIKLDDKGFAVIQEGRIQTEVVKGRVEILLG